MPVDQLIILGTSHLSSSIIFLAYILATLQGVSQDHDEIDLD